MRLTERDKALGDPLSVEEYVLRRIATGATKFLWNGTSEGTGGLKEHGGGNRYRLQYVETNRGKVPELVADDMVYDINENHPELGNVTASEILDIIEGIGVGEQGFSELMERAEELHNSNDYEAQAQAEVEEAEREERANDEAAQERARESVESLSEEEYHETIRPRFVGEMFEEDGTPRFDCGSKRAKANRKVYEFTRDLLRKAGIKVHEVSAEQAQAMANLGQRQEAARFHRAYHGTGAKFDAFDFSHMGEGEGAQAYGWGGYVTEVEGIGIKYAEITSRDKDLLSLDHELSWIEAKLSQAERMLQRYVEELARERVGLEDKEMHLSWFQQESERVKSVYGEGSPQYQEYISNDIYTTSVEVTKNNIQLIEDTINQREKEVAEFEKEYKDKKDEILQRQSSIQRNLYTVEIPDNNGSNYIDYEGGMPREQRARIANAVYDHCISTDKKGLYDGEEARQSLRKALDELFKDNMQGRYIYSYVSDFLGGAKEASELLSRLGFSGISYPRNTPRAVVRTVRGTTSSSRNRT